MSEITTVKKIPDAERIQNAATIHGLAALSAISIWAMGNIWAEQQNHLLPSLIAIISSVVAGKIIAGLMHEWGHFIGARLAKSHSPVVPKVSGFFLFGFDTERNDRDQFLSMSFGGPAANWLLVAMVFFLIPNQSLAEITLLAMVLSSAISVTLFEGPIISRVMDGMSGTDSLNEALDSGSLDRSTVLGYLAGIAIWALLI